MPFEGTDYLFARHHGVVSFLRDSGWEMDQRLTA
jgi:hypothetical protein